jgi:hypothetical protein
MELTTGKWSTKKLAEWFGIRPNSLSRNKEKKLKELKEFADFKITDTGKILIIKVKIPYYHKPNSKTYQYYLDTVPKAWRYN